MLLTNFHLPRSTLLVLVRTFGGDELMRRAYDEAIRQGGDAPLRAAAAEIIDQQRNRLIALVVRCHLMAGANIYGGFGFSRLQQNGLEIGAVKGEARRAPAAHRRIAQGQTAENSAITSAPDDDAVGLRSHSGQGIHKAKFGQNAQSIGRNLETGAHLLNARGALQHKNVETGSGQHQCGGQPAYTCPDNEGKTAHAS